ncbi:MAG: hypothetical protein KKD77_20960 [Gammaproteobacteria bacterium]|nr:hypothetical protein [Gammaproteobacteria bacterium]
MASPLENNLFLSFLSGAGASLAGPESAAVGINSMNQQYFGAKSKATLQDKYMKMLQAMLGGQTTSYPAMFGELIKGGGKMTMDKDGFSLKAPKEALNIGGEESKIGIGSGSGGTSPNLSTTSPEMKDLMSLLNPSEAQQGISGADLAGLTSQDVSQALAGALSVEGLRQETASGIAARALKARELASGERLTDAQIKKLEAETSELTPSITIPGTDIGLTRKQYIEWWKAATKDERTAAIKNYEYAQNKGYKGSFEQFQDAASTTHQKDYAKAKAEGYEKDFNTWMLEMAKAGAINLGDIVERKKATEDIEAQKYFTSPKGLTQDVSKYLNTEEVQNELFRYSNDPAKLGLEKTKKTITFVEGKITGAGGSITDVQWKGDTMVWVVTWPNGETSEVKYGIGTRPTTGK